MVSQSEGEDSPRPFITAARWRLDAGDLPDGFAYPEIFMRVLARQLVELEPWWFLEGRGLVSTRAGLIARYPEHDYIPFAYRQDCDDTACWDGDPTTGVLIVHDFAGPGYEINAHFDTFEAWFRHAVDDMLEW